MSANLSLASSNTAGGEMAPPPVEPPYAPASKPRQNESAKRRMKQPREAEFKFSVSPEFLKKDTKNEDEKTDTKIIGLDSK